MSLFITLEGPEGSGKSSAIEIVYKRLLEEGYEIIRTREPGGTPIAEQIRNVILNKENTKFELLKYHEFGKEKWKKAGLEYTVKDAFVTEELRLDFERKMKDFGLCVIRT